MLGFPGSLRIEAAEETDQVNAHLRQHLLLHHHQHPLSSSSTASPSSPSSPITISILNVNCPLRENMSVWQQTQLEQNIPTRLSSTSEVLLITTVIVIVVIICVNHHYILAFTIATIITITTTTTTIEPLWASLHLRAMIINFRTLVILFKALCTPL